MSFKIGSSWLAVSFVQSVYFINTKIIGFDLLSLLTIFLKPIFALKLQQKISQPLTSVHPRRDQLLIEPYFPIEISKFDYLPEPLYWYSCISLKPSGFRSTRFSFSSFANGFAFTMSNLLAIWKSYSAPVSINVYYFPPTSSLSYVTHADTIFCISLTLRTATTTTSNKQCCEKRFLWRRNSLPLAYYFSQWSNSCLLSSYPV